MSTSRVRLLVASGRRWDASSVQLALVAAQAHDRGLPVVVAVPDLAAPYWRAALPDVSIHALAHEASARAHRADVKALADSIRANVALVDDDVMRGVAARAIGDRGCVLHRVGLDEALPPESFARRLAARRTPTGVLQPTLGDADAERPSRTRVPVFTIPFATGVFTPQNQSADDRSGETLGDTRGGTPGESFSMPRATRATPVLLVIPDPDHPLAALPAIRAAAQVVKRQEGLRVHILGEPRVTQGLRVQAAALRIADAVTTGPLPAAGVDVPGGTVAAWVTAVGDSGAQAALSAMAQRVPVLLDDTSPLAAAITHAVTGVLLDHSDPLADAIAAGYIARLIAHDDERRSMGAAARARVQRLHGAERLANLVLEASERLIAMARRAA